MEIADDAKDARLHPRGDRSDRSPREGSFDGGPAGDEPEPAPPRLEVLEALWNHIGEFRAYAEELVRIEKDRAKLSLREGLARFRREALVFFALCTLVVIGSIYTLTGLSAGLAALFEDQPWIGNLLLGISALVGAVVWMSLREARKSKIELDRKLAEYEERQAEQRARFGRHIADRYADPGSASFADRTGAAGPAGSSGPRGNGAGPR